MAIPTISGVIRRRLLVNFRVDPLVIRPLVPGRFEVVTLDGAAIAGVCLIRLERMHPSVTGLRAGLASDNAAYRVAVRWRDGGIEHDGVFVIRRDTSSVLQASLGGRAFPGRFGRATFEVDDDGDRVALACTTADGAGDLRLLGAATDALPPASVFPTLDAASSFFERGADGYSASGGGSRLEGIRLLTETWSVRPFAVDAVRSAFFEDPARFPHGSVAFDDALVMRDVRHAWRPLPAPAMAS